MKIPKVITNSGNLTYVLDGQAFSFKRSYLLYDKILDILNNDGDISLLKKISNINNHINSWGKNKIFCKNGNIYIKRGKEEHLISDKIHAKILLLLEENKDSEYMFSFLINLLDNPSVESITSLYDFLQYKELPLTEDGCFLAYKSVTNNYMDIYTRSIDNSIGSIVSVPRQSVDSNRDNHCSNGLHVGAFKYVKQYGGFSDSFDIPEDQWKGNRIIIVKVNPKDAVSVPKDHNFQKLRVCRYEVVDELKNSNLVFNTSVVHLTKKVSN